MNDRLVINAVKTILQDNLEDPRQQYTSTDRNWIHTDEPLASATFPRIQVRKRGPSLAEIIGIGQNYPEQRAIILDIQMWSRAPFKWKGLDNVYLQDEELLKEWQYKIWLALKNNQATLKSTYGIAGVKNLGEDDPYMEPDTQLYTAIISVRLMYFIVPDGC